MTTEELDEQAERYASGKMEPDELIRYEALKRKNAESEEIFYLNQSLYHTLNPGQKGFRKKLETIRSDLRSTSETKPLIKRGIIFWISLAAGITLLIALFLFFDSKNSPATPEELYMAYMQQPVSLSPDLSPSRSGGVDSIHRKPEDSILIKADELYMNGNVKGAVQVLESAMVYSGTERIRFQIALLYLMAGQPREAIVMFQSIRDYNQSEIYWYTALGHLSLGDPDNAKAKLKDIGDDSRWYQKSRELMGKL